MVCSRCVEIEDCAMDLGAEPVVEHADCCIIGRRVEGGKLRLCEEAYIAVVPSS
jgi:hypothetical protein